MTPTENRSKLSKTEKHIVTFALVIVTVLCIFNIAAINTYKHRAAREKLECGEAYVDTLGMLTSDVDSIIRVCD